MDDKKVTDHHAVIPTKQRIEPSALSPDEKRVYDLVARRFLAAFFPDAELERTTVTTEVEGERFITRGVVQGGLARVDPPAGLEEVVRRPRTKTTRGAAAAQGARTRRGHQRRAVWPADEGPAALLRVALLSARWRRRPESRGRELRLAMRRRLGTPATRANSSRRFSSASTSGARRSRSSHGEGAALIRCFRTALEVAQLTGVEQKLLAHDSARVCLRRLHGEVTGIVVSWSRRSPLAV